MGVSADGGHGENMVVPGCSGYNQIVASLKIAVITQILLLFYMQYIF